jgi:DNA modification methylase
MNANRGTERGRDMLEKSLRQYGAGRSILLDKHGRIIAGNKTAQTAAEIGLDDLVVVETDGKQVVAVKRMDLDLENDDDARALAYADNRVAEVDLDFDPLQMVMDRDAGKLPDFWTDEEIAELTGAEAAPIENASLSDRFIIPPFSVLDARAGAWQGRKRAWLSKGIESAEGRGDNLLGMNPDMYSPKYGQSPQKIIGTSIFDPVVCEIAYSWFCPPGGVIVDPFAGGSVRGIMAAELGREYVGVDIRKEQVEANNRQFSKYSDNDALNTPVWVVGDSRNIKSIAPGEYDFLFSCPPYFDLEKYSDDADDLSNMDYVQFLESYSQIIHECYDLMKPDTFAVFVVGEVRGDGGMFRNFVGETIKAFLGAGFGFYNEAVLVSPVGVLRLRAGGAFEKSRKIGKGHQNFLVFVKGDPVAATAKCGHVDVAEIDDAD